MASSLAVMPAAACSRLPALPQPDQDEGRLVVTPHAAWFTPESEHDTRVKSAETMRAALLTNRPQNVITPDMF